MAGHEKQSEKYSVSLTGEFYVAAELQRHGISASLTYGNAKRADVLAFWPDSNRYAKVEVKSTWSEKPVWLVGHHARQEENISPDVFWVLVLVPRPETDEPVKAGKGATPLHPEFFVLTSEELARAVQAVDEKYQEGYRKRNPGKGDYDVSKGVPQISVAAIRAIAEPGQWRKIKTRLAAHD